MGMTQKARLFKDGNAWCAVGCHFRDLAVDVAGFGDTQTEALADLNKHEREPTRLEGMVVVPEHVKDVWTYLN